MNLGVLHYEYNFHKLDKKGRLTHAKLLQVDVSQILEIGMIIYIFLREDAPFFIQHQKLPKSRQL